MPNPSATAGDEYRASLTSAGISPNAVQGILNISGEAYVNFSKQEDRPNFGDAIGAVNRFHSDLQSFINTQPKKDQDAYGAWRDNEKNHYKC
ncbi:unnamed protein product [Caenorhabditis brenneri]